MDLEREADFSNPARQAGSGAMLLVTHRWGGGTERHVQEMASLLESDGIPVFLCRTGLRNTSLLIERPASVEKAESAIEINQDLEEFRQTLRGLRIGHMHIHHLAGFSDGASDFFWAACLKAGIQYDVTLHDYMTFCPRIFLSDISGMYCGEPDLDACEACIRIGGSPFGYPSVRSWRERFARLLARARRVFVPSADLASRMARFMPHVVFTVRPHPDRPGSLVSETPKREPRRPSKARQERPIKRVGVIGAIGPHKGSNLLLDVARFAQAEKLPLRFNIIGYTNRDRELNSLDNVEVLGRYEANHEEDLVTRAELDLAWFPSVVLETYCYSLTTALKADLFPLAFDFGAIAERLRAAGWGDLIPYELMLDPPAVARRLAEVTVTPPPPDLSGRISNRYGRPLTSSYYGLDSWPPALSR